VARRKIKADAPTFVHFFMKLLNVMSAPIILWHVTYNKILVDFFFLKKKKKKREGVVETPPLAKWGI
jgi:hypothetical protein